jgi:hypothetical protein
MSAKLVFDGLEELRATLRTLPADLAREAVPIVNAAAERMRGELVTAYPEHTGNLKRGVTLGRIGSTGRFGAAMTVRSAASHAWWYEHGTKPRRNKKNVLLGAMPPNDLFIPLAVRTRTWMYQQFQALLERVGFEVKAA